MNETIYVQYTWNSSEMLKAEQYNLQSSGIFSHSYSICMNLVDFIGILDTPEGFLLYSNKYAYHWLSNI